ncbi:leucine-rich repeat protein [Acetobacterium woodii]|uniref:PKD domain-containing protein n=1 Tax=Acetobacterium woodii (strain ATCC 29683 / DSM 1030 / JCM 2381 / KCTC 1655 / WB1) TaxID=931626 RepID=H6LFD8_ACEWD|nr:leucine-rich repeat protein [Acetobacterium woodii]AFA49425.1 hypothetical protein Awo_c26720 [Acetobacterium woodii DSM 1030]
MKSRLNKIVSIIISILLVVSSMPIGVLAEEIDQPVATVTENAADPNETSFQANELDVPAVLDTATNIEKPNQDLQRVALSSADTEVMTASETMGTMATSGDYSYDVDDNEAIITSYTGTDADVTIPTSLDGKTVVKIGAGAFKDCTTIETLEIPFTVTSIDSAADNHTFGGCSSLKNVTIPSSVIKIGPNAFEKNSILKITGESGSLANNYASEYNITFVPLSFSISDFKTSLESGQNVKTPITLTTTITCGSGTISYQFYYDLVDLSGNKTSVTLQDWSTAATAVLTPTTAGTYTLYTNVKDSSGYICTKVISKYEIVNKPVIASFSPAINSPQYINETILLTAALESATGTAPYTYEFSSQQGSTRKVLKPYSTENTCNFIPTTAGAYTLYVTVKDSVGQTATATITDYVAVDYLNLESFTVDKTGTQELGTDLNLSVLASGGKTDTTEYRFYYTLDSDPTEHEIQEYSDLTKVLFTPTQAGTYHFCVDLTNASGKIEKCPAAKIIDVVIVDTPDIGSFTVAKADGSQFYIGDTDPIILTADTITEGTGPYTYIFYYTTAKITEKQKIETTPATPNTNNTISFKPDTAGTYTFYVDVTDTTSTTATKTSSNYAVYDTLAGTLTTDKNSPQSKETTVKLTANGSGGKAPYSYQFFYKLGADYLPIADASTNKTVSQYFTEPGDYQLKVEITDANDVAVEVPLADKYTIRDNSIITKFYTDRDNEVGHYVGDAILLTVETEGGTANSTYQFSCKSGARTIWSSNATTSKTATYAGPTSAGRYTFTVTVVDVDGTTDTETLKSYQVLATPSAKAVKVNKTSGVILGDIIKLTASGTGGKSAYSYQFYYKKDADTTYTAIGGATKNKTINFPCDSLGTYTFYVEIKDAYDKPSVNRDETGSVAIKVTNPPVIKNFTAIKDQTVGKTESPVVYEKDTVDLTVTVQDAKGEGDLTYDFYYTQGKTKIPIGSSQTITPRITNEQATVKFIPPAAGTYNLFVAVSDTKGSVDTERIASYKVLSGGTSKAVKLSKTSGLNVGDTIKLTATGSGGKSPYLYQYYVKGPSDLAFQPYGTATKSKTISYTFPSNVTGDYLFAVKITDYYGVTLSEITETESVKTTVANPPDITELTVDKIAGTVGTTVAYEGDTVKLAVDQKAATGDGTVNYQFEVKQGTKKLWQSTDSTTDNVTYLLPAAGTYTFSVTATDSAGSKDVYSVKSFKVYPKLEAKSIKSNKTKDLIVGDQIKLSATGAGGQAAYTYQFRYKKDAAVSYTPIGSSDKNKNITFELLAAGSYTFSVVVTDKNGVVSTNEITTQVVVGNPPVIQSFLASPAKGAAVYNGDTITLTANVKEETGMTSSLTYDFYYKQGTSQVDLLTTSTSTYTASATFKPENAGNYDFYVDITDGNSTVTEKLTRYAVLSDVAVKSIKTDKSSGVNIGTTVKVTATATGGKSPYSYQFYSKSADNSENTFKTYSSSATAEFKPTVAGFYSLHVRIKDANGKICSNDDAIFIQDFEVVDYPVLKSLTSSLPSGQYVDTEIVLTATASGGVTPYNYTFAAKRTGGAEETLVADTVNPNQAKFTPTEAGSYTLSVTLTDKDNNASTPAKMEIRSYQIYAKPSVKTFTVSKDTVKVKSRVTIKAVIEGGMSPYKYKFTYTKDGGSETLIRDFSSTSSYSFIPQTAGDYTFHVYIMDKLGTSAEMEGDKTLKVTTE